MKINITNEDRRALNKVFKTFGRKKTEEEIFYNLCFCLMAPQTTFKNNIKVIQKLKELDFYYFGEAYEGYCGITQIEEILKPVRFYKNKTKYILEAKKKFPEILQAISSLDIWDNKQSIHVVDIYKIREWLIDNVKGLGYKASSHFLRNLGYGDNITIIDTHIIKFLKEIENQYPKRYEGLWLQLKNTEDSHLTKSIYLKLEKIFQNIAKENKVSCAELDSWLWKNYSGTSWEDFKY
jgi:N-glycosylase/DNA lyase